MTNFVLERWGVCFFVALIGFFFCSALSSLWLRESLVCYVGLLLYLPMPELCQTSLHCCLLLCFLSTFLNALALNLPVSDLCFLFWVWLQNSKFNIQLVIYYTLYPMTHNCFLWFFKTIRTQHWTNVGYRKTIAFLFYFISFFVLFVCISLHWSHILNILYSIHIWNIACSSI